MKRNKYNLAVIRSAEIGNVTIPPNSSTDIQDMTCKELEFHSTCAMLVQSDESFVPNEPRQANLCLRAFCHDKF